MAQRTKERALPLLCLAAACFGLALVYSATRYDPALHALPAKQAAALAAGLAGALVLTWVDLERLLARLWWLLAAGNVGLLLLLVPLGKDDGTGNRSWIALPGGLFNLQPAEFGKLVFVLLLACQLVRLERGGLARPGMSKKPRRVSRPQARNKAKSFSPGTCAPGKILLSPQVCELPVGDGQRVRAGGCIPPVGKLRRSFSTVSGGLARPRALLGPTVHALGLCGLLWAVSGDVGMVTVYLGIYLVMLWAAGSPPLWLLAQIGAGIGALALLWGRLPEYIRLRMAVVLDHDLDPLGKGFQQERSLLAIGSGRVTGQGWLQGIQTQSAASSALPERHTDFLFAVCGEELGLIGCVLVLALLAAVVLRCVRIAARAEGALLRHVAVGVGASLAVPALLNLGMCLYAAPVIGVGLPFFSYGGSAMVSDLLAVGAVLSLVRRDRRRIV